MTTERTMPVTTRRITETGTPRSLPPPRMANSGSDIGMPVTCVPLEKASAMPCSIQPMARVPISDGIPMTWLVKALSTPTPVAASNAMSAARVGFNPEWINSAARTPVST